MDTQIAVFKERVDVSIGRQNTSQSITPTIVAEKLKDLADIVGERSVPNGTAEYLLNVEDFLYTEKAGQKYKISIQSFFEKTGLSAAEGEVYDFTGTSIDDEVIAF